MFDSMLNLFLLVWLLLVSNLSVWGPQLKVGINLPADASSNLRRRPEMMMMMIAMMMMMVVMVVMMVRRVMMAVTMAMMVI